MLRAVLFAAIITSFAAAPSYPQTISDLTVNADKMSYSEDGKILSASGSVEAESGSTFIKTADFTYDIDSRDITAVNGFEMRMGGGLTLNGSSADYNLKTKKGVTKDVSLKYRRSAMSGSSAYMDEDKIELKDASFTTCDLDPPHYRMTSMTTTVYPDDGWVIGYFGFLWLGSYPVLPVPIYMYDLTSLGSGRRREIKDVLSWPEIGYNEEDGNYIQYKVPWVANRKLNGRVHLLYTEKGGMAEGIEGNYEINDFNDLNMRLFYDPRYDYFGGLTHRYYFGPSIGQKEQVLYNFFKIQERLLCEVETNISHRERINYERVSMLPDVTLRLNSVPAFFDNFSIGGEVSYGRITEETSGAGSDRGVLNTVGTFVFPTDLGRLALDLGYNQSWYSFDMSWTRLSDRLTLSKDLGYGFDGYATHLHYIHYTGNSPFNFEKYFTLPSDEFGFGLGYNFFSHRLMIDYSYYVPDWEPLDLDYGISIGFHCFNLDMKYRTMRKEFIFGVSLVAI